MDDSREQTFTLASGCSAQNAATGSAAVVDTVGPVPSRSVAEMPDRIAAASALSASCSASTLFAQTTSRSPSGVRPSKFCPRWMRVTLSSRSSLAIDVDRAGCDT